MLVKRITLGAQGEIFPDVLGDLRDAGVVFVELGGDEVPLRTLRRAVDPGEVGHRASIQPDAGTDGHVAIVGQFGGIDDVRRDEPPAVAFQPFDLSADTELHGQRVIVVGLQVFVVIIQVTEHQVLAVRVATVGRGGFRFDVIPTGMRHAGFAQAAEEEFAVEDELLVAEAAAEADVGGAFGFLLADDVEAEGHIEGAEVFRPVLPLGGGGLPLYVGEVISLIKHRVGGLQVFFQMVPGSA